MNEVPTGSRQAADLVLSGARLLSVDHRGVEHDGVEGVSALAVRDGVIVAVGSDDHVEHWVGPATERRRLAGHTVTAGLFDSHNHMLKTALGARLPSLASARDVADVLGIVATAAAATPQERWVECSPRWHESALAEGRLPTAQELDTVAPDRPVLLRRGGHNAVFNTRALELLAVRDAGAAPDGATVVVDAAGRPTGRVIGAPYLNALAARVPVPTVAEKREALRDLAVHYHRAGLTSIVEPGLGAEDLAMFADLAESGELPLRTHAMWRVAYHNERIDDVVAAITQGHVERRSGAWFSVFGIKLSMDGGAETGFYRDPYLRPDDPCCPHGKPLLAQDDFVAICTAAARGRWHVGVHCVGDAAADAVIAGFSAVHDSVAIDDLRWSLIHLLNPRAEHWPRVGRLGLTVTAQQGLAHALSDGFAHYLGEERADDIAPLAEYLRHSPLPVGGGSDSPVATYDPWVAISSSVTRANANGRVRGARHAISARAALGMYTTGSAFCAFQEDAVGALAPGRAADLLVLPPGAFIEPESVPTGPLVTILAGKVVHDVL